MHQIHIFLPNNMFLLSSNIINIKNLPFIDIPSEVPLFVRFRINANLVWQKKHVSEVIDQHIQLLAISHPPRITGMDMPKRKPVFQWFVHGSIEAVAPHIQHIHTTSSVPTAVFKIKQIFIIQDSTKLFSTVVTDPMEEEWLDIMVCLPCWTLTICHLTSRNQWIVTTALTIIKEILWTRSDTKRVWWSYWAERQSRIILTVSEFRDQVTCIKPHTSVPTLHTVTMNNNLLRNQPS